MEVYKVADKMAIGELDMVANMEVEMVVDIIMWTRWPI